MAVLRLHCKSDCHLSLLLLLQAPAQPNLRVWGAGFMYLSMLLASLAESSSLRCPACIAACCSRDGGQMVVQSW